jgi:hypothetical protein
MGNMAAIDMAEHCDDIEVALAWHLQSNHYPAVPLMMVPVCIAAIVSANADAWDEPVELPDGVRYRGEGCVPAWKVVEDFHLDAWIVGE